MRFLRIFPAALLLATCASTTAEKLSSNEFTQLENKIRLDTKRTIVAEMRSINNPQINRSFTFDGTRPVFNPDRFRYPRIRYVPGSADDFERFAAAVNKAFDEEERRRKMCMAAICTDKNHTAFARSSKDNDNDSDDDVEKSRKQADAAEKAANDEKIAKKLADIIKERERDRHEACKRYGAGC